MEDLLATPQARAGPTSRLLRRQSQGGGALGRPAAPRTPTHALNASMKLLDDALGSPIPPAEHYLTEDVTRMMEVTRPVDSTRLATRGDQTMRSMRGDLTMAVDVTRPCLEVSAMLGEENPGVAATENLFQVMGCHVAQRKSRRILTLTIFCRISFPRCRVGTVGRPRWTALRSWNRWWVQA